MKTFLLFAVLFAVVNQTTRAIVPVELVRTVFLLQDTPNLATPGIAHAGNALAWGIFALCMYLGLPRNPHRPVIRDVHAIDWSALGMLNVDVATMATYIDKIAEMDKDGCLARLMCHLKAMPESELTFLQKIMLQSIGTSANPDPTSGWSYSPEHSARRRFVAAIEYGRLTRCSKCCQNYYQSCSMDNQDMLRLF